MTRPGGCAFRLLLAMASLHLGDGLCRAQQPPFFIEDQFEPLDHNADRGDVLSTLRPVVRRFDFDDLQTGPNALPPNFFRYIAPSQGFPPFGEMRVVAGRGFTAPDQRPSDTGALEFTLAGGSMSARIGASVIPVLPFADYIVACRVRTDGLHRAKAKLVAWLCDASGRIIEASRVESRAAAAADGWDMLSLEMHGNFADAADLVFELQLVQPARSEGVELLDPDPRMQDVRGRAWFDDVSVSHLPRVVLDMSPSGTIITPGSPAKFAVQVNEPASKALVTRLRIVDFNGEVVADQHFPAPRGREPSIVAVPMNICGWYRAVLDVTSNEHVSRRRWVDFIVQPTSGRAVDAPRPFGFALQAGSAFDALREAGMAAAAKCGTAVVPAWDLQTTLAKLPQTMSQRQVLIEQLLRSDVDVAFSLRGVPEELARTSGSFGRTALEVMAGDATRWRPYVDDLLTHFGLTINRWIVGEGDDLIAGVPDSAIVNADAARRTLAAFVPGPALHVAWPIEQQPVSDQLPSAVAVRVPAGIAAAALPEFLEPWLISPTRSTIVSLELLPTRGYAPRQRLVDALQRGLNAWRAGATDVIIDQPWRTVGEERPTATPDIVFAAWRTLNVQLAGRRFVSELPFGPDVHVWAVAGQDGRDAAVIAWCDRDRSAGPMRLDLQIADRAVQVIDAFGNVNALDPIDGLHRLSLSDVPVFVQGVSLELLLFRGGVRIEPSFVAAESRVHEHEIVIRNPWETIVAGTLRLAGEADLQISPLVQDFSIPARGETRLPIQIVPQRGILAGPRHLATEITINADRLHTLRMDLDLEVGLKDIEVNVAWSTMHNPLTGVDDLLISPAVTNRMGSQVNLDVDLLADGVRQMRRTIAGLQPGQTQTRTFRVPDGARILAGQTIRLGVSQRDGVARLNKMITIGTRDGDSELAGAPTGE